MRKIGVPCETCYASRPARFIFPYGPLGMCWVCKLRTISPQWFCRVIDYFDPSGATPPQTEEDEL